MQVVDVQHVALVGGIFLVGVVAIVAAAAVSVAFYMGREGRA